MLEEAFEIAVGDELLGFVRDVGMLDGEHHGAADVVGGS